MSFHMRSIDSRIRLGSPATSIACKAIDKFQSTIERGMKEMKLASLTVLINKPFKSLQIGGVTSSL